MMDYFYMNGYLWHIKIVDPYSKELVDRTGEKRVATTDPNRLCVYLSSELSGDFLITVLIHELGHCTMISYDLIDYIHEMVKQEYWIEAEEFMCNFIADYGIQMYKIAYKVLGEYALLYLPKELERFVS